ncbi:MAG: FAD-binding oxidoreductase [Actinobacteria bacterium]|nr:FAD-binding oxidoreductase [Actinomycetota bacterium]
MQVRNAHDPSFVAQLEAVVGPEFVSTDPASRFAYSIDTYWVGQMWLDRGHATPTPDVVVRPATPQEVAAVIHLAAEHRVPVTPWGGGSGSQGGALALYGGIVLDLKRLNRVLEIDETSLTVTAEAGINGRALEWEVNRYGLTLAHYPASQNCATLGGYLAPRGSGVLSTKYGKAEDIVMSVQVALGDGSLIRTPGLPSHASGPNLMGLFVGSEGTLGVITEATMRLDPLPETRSFRAFGFPDLQAGLEAGRQVMVSRLRPSVMRLYDEPSSERVIERVLGTHPGGTCLIIGFDGYPEIVEAEERRAVGHCEDLGGRDLGPEFANHWWDHRYDFYYPPFHLHQPVLYGTTDTVARFKDIHDLYVAKKRVIEDEFSDWDAAYMAHFSHWFPWGVMVYDRFTIQSPPSSPQDAVRLHNKVWDAAARASLEHGGVLNEHHGIGVKLGRLMPEFYDSAWGLLVGVKDVCDPAGILNPGKQGFTVPTEFEPPVKIDMGEH